MPRFSISPRAQRDFFEILEHLNSVAGSSVARKYGRDIQAAVNRIADFPALGSLRPALGVDLRVVRVRPYLVFYEFTADDELVRVLRILHERRNITPELVRRT